jgi:ricin-type beta-trefoil lectin protein
VHRWQAIQAKVIRPVAGRPDEAVSVAQTTTELSKGLSVSGIAKKLPGGRAVGARAGRTARWLAAAAAAFCAASAAVVVNASPAQANPGSNYLRNMATGRCLEFNGASLFTSSSCSYGNRKQAWMPVIIGHTDHDHVLLVATDLGHGCLNGGDRGNAIYLEACGPSNSRPSQDWKAVGQSYHQVQYVNANGRCLDSNDAGDVYLHDCNNGGFQQWKLGY